MKQKIFKIFKLLGTLRASLLWNLLTGKGIVRVGSGNKKGKKNVRAGSKNKKWKEIVRAGSGNKKGKGIVRAGTGRLLSSASQKKWDF